MLKHNRIQHGYVKDRKHGNPPRHNRPEEELVSPDVVHPLREVFLGLGLHAEE